jgi:hypothetical protein
LTMNAGGALANARAETGVPGSLQRAVAYIGAPRSIKMGTMLSPWRYDGTRTGSLPSPAARPSCQRLYDVAVDGTPNMAADCWGFMGRRRLSCWVRPQNLHVFARRTRRSVSFLGHQPLASVSCHQIGDMIWLRHAGDCPPDIEGILGASPAC